MPLWMSSRWALWFGWGTEKIGVAACGRNPVVSRSRLPGTLSATVACRLVLAVFVLEEDLDRGLVAAGEGSPTENGHAVDQGGPSGAVALTDDRLGQGGSMRRRYVQVPPPRSSLRGSGSHRM
jgi:hypothetical protein